MKDSARGAAEVQSGLSSPAGQGESGEVSLADGLPAGWESSEIGELCDLINGRGFKTKEWTETGLCLLYTSPSPRD